MVDVSVVIPTKDRPCLLARTLKTVLAQVDVAIEVVVVDDGSAAPVLQGTQHPQIRVLRNSPAKGVSQARNAGIASALGDWIAFADDDDLWLPGKLRVQLDVAARAGALWAFGSALHFRDRSRILSVERAPDGEEAVRCLPWRNVVPGGCSNVIVHSSLLQSAGGFDSGLSAVADWDLWIRLGLQAQPAAVRDVVVAYRHHGRNMTRGVAAMLDEHRHMENRYRALRGGKPIDWDATYRWLGQSSLHDGRRLLAASLYLRSWLLGRRRRSLRQVARSLLPISVRPERDQRVTMADTLASGFPDVASVAAWLEDVDECTLPLGRGPR